MSLSDDKAIVPLVGQYFSLAPFNLQSKSLELSLRTKLQKNPQGKT